MAKSSSTRSQSFKALGLLLMYPAPEIQEACPYALAIIEAEGLVPAERLRPLRTLAHQLANDDALDLQARYVQLFDRNRSLSLNLYEHVHGESRDRGAAMAELKGLYEAEGLDMATGELPDHLPVFLEFLSLLDVGRARMLLGEAAHVIAAIGERLKKRKSPYQAVFVALAALAASTADPKAVAALLAEPEDDPDDLEALDRAWAEEPVSFGPGEAGCPKVSDLVARPAPPTTQGANGHAF
ncbi:MAG: nitrate reductase molybdenum cofactor assembly chaperone [Beijerinckiaceae bacterium]|jgi:nitrate reductase delta subunit|nr:nitrate reductase molybdenum cofactor assembly chaperone [Beijerinckiaceae bacterium]